MDTNVYSEHHLFQSRNLVHAVYHHNGSPQGIPCADSRTFWPADMALVEKQKEIQSMEEALMEILSAIASALLLSLKTAVGFIAALGLFILWLEHRKP